MRLISSRMFSLTVGTLLFSTAAHAVVEVEELDEAVREGVTRVVSMEEGEDGGEWPYEGVYRYRGSIPIGYRVGGTGIAALAMALTPGYDEDESRQQAVSRAITFICAGTGHDLMSPDYDGGYDVRGWGYTYGALALLTLEREDLLPEAQVDEAREASGFYVAALQKIEIPEIGGWNYARANGGRPSPPSSFMTASALQTLFIASDLGYEVDAGVVERGLAFLDKNRARSGEFVYSGEASQRGAGGVPGAIGRMVIGETTLHLAGRRDEADVRGALDAFLVHWEELEKRRAKTGTHVAPYGVAPYYFFFAHHYAAQAAEVLPRREREVYRGKLNGLLMSVRDAESGTWNDRVFDRSANYGTSMAVLAIRMPDIGLPAQWDEGED